MPANIEKNMYLRRHQGKITLLWFPKNTDKLCFFVKIKLSWRQKILQKYWKKNVLKTHLIHRFSWYSLEVDVGHLGADFRPLGIIFSPESHYWVFISCLLELIMGLWEAIFDYYESTGGLWESILGLYESIMNVSGVDFGSMGVDFRFWKSS